MILNNAIRMGALLPHAAKFVGKHQQALSQVPVAYFVLCGRMKDNGEQDRLTVEAYLHPVREMLEPQEIGLFERAVDYSKLPIPARTMSKATKMSERDLGPWEPIRSCAR